MSEPQPDFSLYTVSSSPAWLRGPQGEAWLLVHGLVHDAQVEAATRAALADMPLRTSTDGLPLIAYERLLEQAPGETLEGWRVRLDGAWDVWPTGGTVPGLLTTLATYGFPGAILWTSHEVDPPSPLWARFWLALPSTPWGTDGTWDDPDVWDDGGVWDSTATVDAVNRLVRLIRLWKPARSRCVSVALLLSPTAELWDVPDGSWDEPGGVWGEGEEGGVSFLFPEDYPT